MRALSPHTATGAVILAIHMAWLLIEALRSGCPPLVQDLALNNPPKLTVIAAVLPLSTILRRITAPQTAARGAGEKAGTSVGSH